MKSHQNPSKTRFNVLEPRYDIKKSIKTLSDPSKPCKIGCSFIKTSENP